MDVVSIAAKKRQQISSYQVHVDGTQRDEYPQILTSITVTHEVEGPKVEVAAIRRAIELSALKYCPVNAMLSAGATEVHHRFVIRNTGPEPFETEGEAAVTGPFRRPDPIALTESCPCRNLFAAPPFPSSSCLGSPRWQPARARPRASLQQRRSRVA